MQFNPENTANSLVADIDFWLFGTSTTFNTAFPIADRTRRINERLNKVVSIIFQNDRRWKYDDFNQEDMNIFYATLVEGQQDYEVSGADFLTIEEVAVKDSNGKYKILSPVIREGETTQELQDLEGGNNGMPIKYEKNGNSILLYPKPSLSVLTASEGLMVRGKRLPAYFEIDDTTKQPGFNPLYHGYLSIGASYDYALANGMNAKVAQLQPELIRLEADIANDYSNRARDDKPKMTTSDSEEYIDNLY